MHASNLTSDKFCHFPAIVENGVLARKGSQVMIKLTSRRHIAVSKYSHILVYTDHPVFFTGHNLSLTHLYFLAACSWKFRNGSKGHCQKK